jgi:hypothetical protein
MIHPDNISWVSSLLIAIGVVLQLIAVCVFIRERSLYWHPTYSGEERMDVPEQDMESRVSDEVAPVEATSMHDESVDEDAHAETKIRAGNLTRTEKVTFVQSFKFRT